MYNKALSTIYDRELWMLTISNMDRSGLHMIRIQSNIYKIYHYDLLCQGDQAEIIKQHLSFGADINTKDAGGWSPLHWAVGEGHEKIIKLLLAKKADVNAIDQTGKTALDYALLNKKKDVNM